MAFEHYIAAGGKRVRCGYTTGTCAALAAQGAARLLITGKAIGTARLMTPKGLAVEAPLLDCRLEGGAAACSVQKDGGDDVDATHGLLIRATLRPVPGGDVVIRGGEGVGRVTKPGLDQPVGAAAINRVPRQMILEAVEGVREESGYDGGLEVTISVPGGQEAARKTFNPQLGVEGGVSILGTSGIVEPMSARALVDTIALELRQHAAQGENRVILTPGNYGVNFLTEQGLDRLNITIIKCSNFIGEALDAARLEGFSQVLLAGHLGKLVKVAGGVMNTHSRWADCRTEIICAQAAACGASRQLAGELLAAATTDACLELLDKENLREPVLERLLTAIDAHLKRRVGEDVHIGAVLFTNQYGLLGMTEEGKDLLERWKNR